MALKTLAEQYRAQLGPYALTSAVEAGATRVRLRLRHRPNERPPSPRLALIEMEDLFGHEPLSTEMKRDVQQFYEESRGAGRYDFMSGARLADAVRTAGLRVVHREALPDRELCFQGAANDEVLTAWRNRLARMNGLQNFLGAKYGVFKQAFLNALSAAEHRSTTKVTLVVAVKAHP